MSHPFQFITRFGETGKLSRLDDVNLYYFVE